MSESFIDWIFQDEMTNALALMRVDQVTPIKNLDTANNKLLKKRQKRNKSVEEVKWKTYQAKATVEQNSSIATKQIPSQVPALCDLVPLATTVDIELPYCVGFNGNNDIVSLLTCQV